MSINGPEYLGDGVYGYYSNGALRLYTDNGVEQANEIFIDGDVLTSMFKYIERCLYVKINVSDAAQKNNESGGTCGKKEPCQEAVQISLF